MARFVYIDETGSVGTGGKRQPYLTLVAAIVDESTVQPRARDHAGSHRSISNGPTPWSFTATRSSGGPIIGRARHRPNSSPSTRTQSRSWTSSTSTSRGRPSTRRGFMRIRRRCRRQRLPARSPIPSGADRPEPRVVAEGARRRRDERAAAARRRDGRGSAGVRLRRRGTGQETEQDHRTTSLRSSYESRCRTTAAASRPQRIAPHAAGARRNCSPISMKPRRQSPHKAFK